MSLIFQNYGKPGKDLPLCILEYHLNSLITLRCIQKTNIGHTFEQTMEYIQIFGYIPYFNISEPSKQLWSTPNLGC